LKKRLEGEYDFADYHTETLKDELRDLHKVEKPRCFKVTPLDLLFVEKQLLGNMMDKLHKNRLSNGIMVGINPFSKEWEVLLRRLTSRGDNVFDGDFGKWDGHMLSQFQQVLNKELVSRFTGSSQDQLVLSQLLMTMVYTPTITLNETYLTNHSLPTGRGVTADYNSLINKMYGAYVYYILYKEQFGKAPTISTYVKNVYDAVYGDDKLVGVETETSKWFNGKSFERICNIMGFEFTPASKGAWTYLTRSIYDCTFLKRSFRIHQTLGIVAPLDNISMTSTLNFVSDDFRNEELTDTKLHNFQREAYLHQDYHQLMATLLLWLKEHAYPFTPLTEKYLTTLYNSDQYDEFIAYY